jgi:ribosome-associated translation inhibitor RaiA
MTIIINTDKNISGNEKLTAHLKATISESLVRFGDWITRIEVHLSDENSQKKGVNDKRCLIEARLGSLQPIAVTNECDTIEQAVTGAIDKLKALLDTTIGRLKDHKVQ